MARLRELVAPYDDPSPKAISRHVIEGLSLNLFPLLQELTTSSTSVPNPRFTGRRIFYRGVGVIGTGVSLTLGYEAVTSGKGTYDASEIFFGSIAIALLAGLLTNVLWKRKVS